MISLHFMCQLNTLWIHDSSVRTRIHLQDKNDFVLVWYMRHLIRKIASSNYWCACVKAHVLIFGTSTEHSSSAHSSPPQAIQDTFADFTTLSISRSNRFDLIFPCKLLNGFNLYSTYLECKTFCVTKCHRQRVSTSSGYIHDERDQNWYHKSIAFIEIATTDMVRTNRERICFDLLNCARWSPGRMSSSTPNTMYTWELVRYP